MCAQLPDSRVAVGFAEFLRCRLHDERVVQELWRLGAADKTRELQLPAGGREQIVATDHERDALHQVVHRRGELVGPLAVAIAHEQIAALLRRPLLLQTVTQVDEALDGRLEAHP